LGLSPNIEFGKRRKHAVSDAAVQKPLRVPVDDVAAQLSQKIQSQWSKALEVMTQKVVKSSLTTAVILPSIDSTKYSY
jgi:hypothetical protein